MKNSNIWIIALSAAMIVLTVDLYFQYRVFGDWDLKQTEKIKIEAGIRQNNIYKELDARGDLIWPDFYRSGGLGDHLFLALGPRHFVFRRTGCTGQNDVNFGTVKEVSGKIKFRFELPNIKRSFGGFPKSLIVVPWGQRVYLVEPDKLVEFCNEFNGGWEPREDVSEGRTLLQDEEELPRTDGLPTVPVKYKNYLLERPINATVVRTRVLTNTSHRRIDELIIDKGVKDGLLKGMVLYVNGIAGYVDGLVVNKVGNIQSRVLLEQIVYLGITEPKAGWKLSTKME